MATSRRLPVSYNTSTYGAAKDYTEGQLTNWEAATDNDLVSATAGEVLDVYKEGASGGLWDDALTNNWTGANCSSSYFRVIRAAASNGHSGIPKDDGSMAGFRTTANAPFFRIDETYSQIQDIVGKVANNESVSRVAVAPHANGAAAVGVLLLASANAGAYDNLGVSSAADTGETTYVVNCVSIDGDNGFTLIGAGTHILFNSSAHNNGVAGFRCENNNTIKNCCASSNTGGDYVVISGGFTATTCGSADTTSPVVAMRSQSYTFVDSVNEDWHWNAGSTDGIDDGTDLSADGSYAFDDDIDKATRSGTWDIGFDQAGQSVNVSATVRNLTLTEYSTNVNAETSISASLDELTLTEYAASLNAETNVNAALDELTLSTYDATVNAEVSITATVDSLELSQYAATVTIVSTTVGETCWGHVTDVLEDNVRTFADNWTGTGSISGSSDAEIMEIAAGQYMESEVIETGATGVELLQNEYGSGDTVALKYRTGATDELAGDWTAYSVPFASDGYVQVRVESTL